jgi:hypothetical protein
MTLHSSEPYFILHKSRPTHWHTLARLTLAAAAAVSAAPAAQPDYLPCAEVAAILADGQLWTMAASDGKNGRIRFNADSTGRIEQPVSRNIRWSIRRNQFCMRMGFMLGTRCFDGGRTATGIQGHTNGRPNVAFSR